MRTDLNQRAQVRIPARTAPKGSAHGHFLVRTGARAVSMVLLSTSRVRKCFVEKVDNNTKSDQYNFSALKDRQRLARSAEWGVAHRRFGKPLLLSSRCMSFTQGLVKLLRNVVQ